VKIAIIGAGIAGCLAALELQKQHKVTLFDPKGILNHTSSITPNRMGLGFHYFHLPTAMFYLDRTMEFLNEFPFLNKDSLSKNGQYFIMKNSLINSEEIYNNYKLLDLYSINKYNRKLILKNIDKNNNISYAFESAECLLDFTKFKNHILENLKCQIIQEPLIKFEGFDLYINCAWEKMEELNKINNIPLTEYTNRKKMLIKVKLDQELPCKFFAGGPFAMMTNCGNKEYKVTYAPITNIGDKEPNLDLAQQILEGATKYIPELKQAKIFGYDVGVVKSIGDVSIHQRCSDFHKRNYTGIEKYKNVINNPAMKLSYALYNARLIAKMV